MNIVIDRDKQARERESQITALYELMLNLCIYNSLSLYI